jgi:hypothetical protein
MNFAHRALVLAERAVVAVERVASALEKMNELASESNFDHGGWGIARNLDGIMDELRSMRERE